MISLYLLGTGTPTPTPERFGTSFVLERDGACLMVDCGPATTYKLVRAGLWPTKVDHLLFTHHHSDHNADYPCFLMCRFDQSTGHENRLVVRGPTPTASMTERLIGEDGVFAPDWKARVNDPVSQFVHKNRGGSLPRPKPDVDAEDIEPGDAFACGAWSVSTAAVDHVAHSLVSIAYRLEADGKVVAFAGDTGPCETVPELARGADTLVVNCWDHQSTMDDNGEAPGQTGTLDAARMAEEAGAKRLVLAHTGPALSAPGGMEQGIREIASVYGGEIVFGQEGMRLEIG